ncbi:unnamed protein product [Cercospora beticola]|nr:unnamed protein product [Cercospora beticola]
MFKLTFLIAALLAVTANCAIFCSSTTAIDYQGCALNRMPLCCRKERSLAFTNEYAAGYAPRRGVPCAEGGITYCVRK